MNTRYLLPKLLLADLALPAFTQPVDLLPHYNTRYLDRLCRALAALLYFCIVWLAGTQREEPYTYRLVFSCCPFFRGSDRREDSQFWPSKLRSSWVDASRQSHPATITVDILFCNANSISNQIVTGTTQFSARPLAAVGNCSINPPVGDQMRLVIISRLVLMTPYLEDELVQLGLSPLSLTVMLQSLFYKIA